MIDNIKKALNSGKVYDIFPVGDSVSWSNFGRNGVVIGFDLPKTQAKRVDLGNGEFKIVGGGRGFEVTKFKVVIEKLDGKLNFKWLKQLKPIGFLEIEKKLEKVASC